MNSTEIELTPNCVHIEFRKCILCGHWTLQTVREKLREKNTHSFKNVYGFIFLWFENLRFCIAGKNARDSRRREKKPHSKCDRLNHTQTLSTTLDIVSINCHCHTLTQNIHQSPQHNHKSRNKCVFLPAHVRKKTRLQNMLMHILFLFDMCLCVRMHVLFRAHSYVVWLRCWGIYFSVRFVVVVVWNKRCAFAFRSKFKFLCLESSKIPLHSRLSDLKWQSLWFAGYKMLQQNKKKLV